MLQLPKNWVIGCFNILTIHLSGNCKSWSGLWTHCCCITTLNSVSCNTTAIMHPALAAKTFDVGFLTLYTNAGVGMFYRATAHTIQRASSMLVYIKKPR